MGANVIHQPRLAAFVAVIGLTMVSVGIIVPVVNKANPITALVVPGFFVLFAAVFIVIGALDNWSEGDEPPERRPCPPPIAPVAPVATFRMQYLASPRDEVVQAMRVVRGVPVAT